MIESDYEQELPRIKRVLLKSYRNKAVSLSMLNKEEEALLNFNKALEIDRNDYLSLYNKAYTLQNLERHEEAITFFDKAINSIIHEEQSHTVLMPISALVEVEEGFQGIINMIEEFGSEMDTIMKPIVFRLTYEEFNHGNEMEYYEAVLKEMNILPNEYDIHVEISIDVLNQKATLTILNENFEPICSPMDEDWVTFFNCVHDNKFHGKYEMVSVQDEEKFTAQI